MHPFHGAASFHGSTPTHLLFAARSARGRFWPVKGSLPSSATIFDGGFPVDALRRPVWVPFAKDNVYASGFCSRFSAGASPRPRASHLSTQDQPPAQGMLVPFPPQPRYSWSRLTRPRRLLWARIPTFLRRRAGSSANALLQQKEPQMRHNRGPGVQTGCAAAAQAPCPQRANPAPGGRSRRYRHHSRRFHGRLPY